MLQVITQQSLWKNLKWKLKLKFTYNILLKIENTLMYSLFFFIFRLKKLKYEN